MGKISVLLSLLLCINLSGFSQNWFKADSLVLNNNATDTIWREGPILISEYLKNPRNNKLAVISKYDSTNNRGIFVALNEPTDWLNGDGDSTRVGKATAENNNYTALIANNYANFKGETDFTDVHNATAEFNYLRGMPDYYGFRDAGHLERSATLRLSGSFGNNGRDYLNDNFDILNLRFFTSNIPGNLAQITNFYALRMEDFRGVNTSMITNGWGIYIKPSILNNYFGGKVGIGTASVTNALTVNAPTDPLKVTGIQPGNDLMLLSQDASGVVHSKDVSSLNQNFLSVTADVTLSNDYFLYVHNGGNATYTLPAAASRVGKTWKIVNVGTGIITFSMPFKQGDETRNTLLNKSGHYSIELFSDGVNYIAL